jgi:cellulose synthase/poly-beta-1,6-N-acetylglucosamine synthase-like glycosyltransferase
MADNRWSMSDARCPMPVSVVIPVHNGAAWLDRVLTAIESQSYAGPLEIIAVEDGSTDGSREILARHAAAGRVVLIDGPHRGVSAALNAGIRTATHPLIAQIDQDVVIAPGWLDRLVAALDDPAVAAAQGHYVAAAEAGPWSRVMGLDLGLRYRALGRWTNHVCTGNSIYRKSALVETGLFDETFGYAADNDMSYRLTDAGHRLAFCPKALSTHYWREGLFNYARQQYGFGYGRLDLLAKHRGRRVTGDDVSRVTMMLHGPVMAGALVMGAAALVLAAAGGPARVPALTAATLLALLVAERLVAGVRAAVTFRDSAGLWFAPAHLTRDIAWVAAILVWTGRRLSGARSRPSDSMKPR